MTLPVDVPLRECKDLVVGVKVGGINVGGPLRNDNLVCAELRDLNGSVDFDDYVVDLCFMTYVPGGIGSEWAEGIGVSPGMVGRKQRRFIIKIEVPPTLTDLPAYRSWMADALAQAADLIRDYLPKKAKVYPAERLAAEVDDLRYRWGTFRDGK